MPIFDDDYDFVLFLKVINLMVAAGWNTGTSKSKSLTIYNCCTGQNKPITWGRLVSLAIEKMRIHPLGERQFFISDVFK
jgi:fatty acyl-CoA reductase